MTSSALWGPEALGDNTQETCRAIGCPSLPRTEGFLGGQDFQD